MWLRLASIGRVLTIQPGFIASLRDSVRGFGDEPLTAVNSVSQYCLGAGSLLHVAIRTVESRDEPNTHKLLIELRARGHVGSVVKSKTDSWFSDAHSKIVQ